MPVVIENQGHLFILTQKKTGRTLKQTIVLFDNAISFRQKLLPSTSIEPL